jgi:hypothetical protein
MERSIRIVVFAIVLVFAGLATVGFARAAGSCRAPKVVGGWIGNGDTRADEVVSISTLMSTNGADLGWFYMLRNGQLWFQPNLSVRRSSGRNSIVLAASMPGSPAIRIRKIGQKEAARALASYVDSTGVSRSGLPQSIADFVAARSTAIIKKCQP